MGSDGEYHHIYDQSENINSQQALMDLAMSEASERTHVEQRKWQKFTKFINKHFRSH